MADIRMCCVNPALIDALGCMVGTQSEIMTRAGISWNSWIKIVGGLPIRQSVGERLRARVLREAEIIPGLCKMFPSSRPGEVVDYRAIEQVFLTPIAKRGDGTVKARKLRSVREASSLRNEFRTEGAMRRQGTGVA